MAKTKTEVRLTVTWPSGKSRRYAKKNLEAAVKDAGWYETDKLGRVATVETRTVTEEGWVKVDG